MPGGHFFAHYFSDNQGYLLAPWGGVGKLLSSAHPYWGVQHLQINRPQRPF
jgi:hypothetical protein